MAFNVFTFLEIWAQNFSLEEGIPARSSFSQYMMTQFIKKPSTLEKVEGLEKLERIGMSDTSYENVRNGTDIIDVRGQHK